jgi:leucyl/phenylalanyl-tRNA--protein transferase
MSSKSHPPPTVKQVLWAYRRGLFPMADTRDAAGYHWCEPRVRSILPLDGRFHVPRSLAKRLRRGDYRVTRDRAFGRVIDACRDHADDRPETWINAGIASLFKTLHHTGHAHSVEAWSADRLVGGVYGLSLGGAFFGESMFSRATDASKVCLVHLVDHLRQRGYTLLDAQMPNPHLDQFGQVLMPMPQFLELLNVAADLPVTFNGPS